MNRYLFTLCDSCDKDYIYIIDAENKESAIDIFITHLKSTAQYIHLGFHHFRPIAECIDCLIHHITSNVNISNLAEINKFLNSLITYVSQLNSIKTNNSGEFYYITENTITFIPELSEEHKLNIKQFNTIVNRTLNQIKIK